MLDSVWQDLRYAARSLLRRPLVTAAAVLSLALGIGVNTTVFSIFEQVLLRPLPVPVAEQIVLITSPGPRPGGSSTGNAGGPAHVFSYPLFRDLEQLEIPGLSRIAAHRDFPANLSHAGRTARADGHAVSGGYFPALSVRPALGRLLTFEDDRVPGGHPVVVLSYDYWTTHFGSDSRIVGDTLRVNGQPMTIIGVAPEGFRGTTSMESPQVFVPLSMMDRLGLSRQIQAAGQSDVNERTNHWLYLFARLQRGVTREQAQARLNGPFQALLCDVEFPLLGDPLESRERERFLARQILLEHGARPRDSDRADTFLIIGLLLAITGFVLLIACANVANLLLSRAAERASEVAIRLSVGASAGDVVRLLLTEAVLLGVLGSAGALMFAHLASGVLLSLIPADDAALLTFELNYTILVFTIMLGVGTAFLFGIFPAFHGVRGNATLPLGPAGRLSAPRTAVRFRTSLAVAQIALATTLLAQAGLFLTSLVNLARAELGIRPQGVVTFRLSPQLSGYTRERALALFDRIEAELRAVPGVTAVTASTVPILADTSTGRNVTVEGFPTEPGVDVTSRFAQVGVDYFRTLGISLLAGREFTEADAGASPRVAIINEAFARKFRLGSDPVGKRMAIGSGVQSLDIEIVGLVRDAKYDKVREPAPPQFYMPYRQGQFGPLTFYARTAEAPAPLLAMIPRIVARADANLPMERLRTMDDQIWDNTTSDRVLAMLSSWFAGLATVLAAIGLYAMLAYTVTQRVREIGIRIALGASSRAVCALLFRYMGRIGLLGGAIGAAAALALGRISHTLLFGVEGHDPTVVAGAIVGVLLVALLAAAIPTRRAMGTNPADALRAE